jgi:hypothetical protein
MKSLLTLFFGLLISSSLFSQAIAHDINGLWEDSTGNSFTNCHAIFAVKNDSVFMTHYLEFNGTSFVEHGIGLVSNDSLIYTVVVAKGIPGWSTAGIHRLKITNKGNTMSGSYYDNKGNTGPIVFIRKK